MKQQERKNIVLKKKGHTRPDITRRDRETELVGQGDLLGCNTRWLLNRRNGL
jgi:hypothetical protein